MANKGNKMIDVNYIRDAYEQAPNNATNKLVDELKTSFTNMIKPSNAAEVTYNGYTYSVSISSKGTLEARQFRETNDGLLTFSLNDDKVFFIDVENLTLSNTPTRIGPDGSKFFNAKANLFDTEDYMVISDKPKKEIIIHTTDEIYITKKIYRTLNYGQFKSLSGQPKERAKKNAMKLADELDTTKGNYIPIIVNEEFEVIDGNTRLEACKSKNYPVMYEVVDSDDVKSLELMKYMNAANKPWNTYNFIEFYALGYKIPEFVDFKDFIDDRNFAIGIYIAFDNNINQDDIRDGKLPIIDYILMNNRLDYASSLMIAVGDTIKSKQNIARALARFYTHGDFDKVRLLSAINKHWTNLLRKERVNSVIGEYMVAAMLQKCYNYGLSGKNRTRLFEETL